MSAIIKAENLGKKYIIGHQKQRYGDSLRDAMTHIARGIWQRVRHPLSPNRESVDLEELWALKDIDFEVKQGERVGIIGRNGAGKSTLLKILSRITEPTTGKVRIKGRVSSLLEVGTGFHPELTGRENIFLNGAILGMTRQEVKRKFDEIIAFAELEKFLDTPVKRYSSGMYVRLAFAVAAHLEPEILIVDEVLAVGDAQFQKKCLGKMENVAKEGRTVLFVSHNMNAVQNLCQRTLLLEDGRISDDGDPNRIVIDYLNTFRPMQREKIWEEPSAAPGNEKVRLHRVCVRPENGTSKNAITIRTPIALEFEFWNLVPRARLNLSLHLKNEKDITVFNTFPVDESGWCGREFPVGLFRSVCQVHGDLLNNGKYRVLLLIVKNQSSVIFKIEDALSFEVLDDETRRGNWHGTWKGTVRPNLKWQTSCLQEGQWWE